MLTFFGLNFVFNQPPQVWMDFGLLFVFYGLYYGVLGRDISEICADKMASHIGVNYTKILFMHQEEGNVYNEILVLHASRNANKKFGEKCMCCMWKSVINK